MKKLPWKNTCFLAVLSFLGAWGVGYCVNLPENSLAYTNSMAAFLLCGVWFYALRRLTGGENWEAVEKKLTPCFVLLLFFAGSMAAGVQIDRDGAVDFGRWQAWAAVLFLAAAAAPVLAAAVGKGEAVGAKAPEPVSWDPKQARRYFFAVWGILTAAYLLTLFAAFPGFFNYDAEAEVYMVYKDRYSAQQPVLHVLLLGWIIRVTAYVTGSYNMGIVLYLLMQMGVLAACFAYMIRFLRSAGVRRWVCNLGILFLAFFPTVSMFVCCSTKDGLFSGGVVLFTTLLLELHRDVKGFCQSRGKKCLFVLSMLLILFFRNNGIYALGVFLVAGGMVYRRSWRSWLPAAAASFLIFLVATQGLMALFHFRKSPVGEMLSVPMQQLARTYIQEKDTFSEEDLEVLFSLIPEVILQDYNPKLADSVKLNFMEDNFRSSPGKYISLWFRTGLKHFDVYVDAFLVNTYGYWYPDTVIDGYRGIHIMDRVYGDSSYFAFVTENPGTRVHLLPGLERFYEKISLEIYQQRLPVVSMLFSPGFWHWAYIFLAFYLWITGYGRQAFSLGLMGMTYLTVLLGPVVLVRYVLYLFFGVPLFLALLFDAGAVAGAGRFRLNDAGSSAKWQKGESGVSCA